MRAVENESAVSFNLGDVFINVRPFRASGGADDPLCVVCAWQRRLQQRSVSYSVCKFTRFLNTCLCKSLAERVLQNDATSCTDVLLQS